MVSNSNFIITPASEKQSDVNDSLRNDSIANKFPKASSAQPVWGRPAHNHRSVHAVREDGEHCPASKWQVR
ncbi:hypothetical protein GTU26_000277 [Salmonella enterica subsp. enterica]|nr:hypothetical protein [Salmonella enterica subsp. enterica serovar Stanleyville]EBG1088366.1 hypothetical protein [Salmonella enterica]ECD7816105.1 hypothetical protein [Salmonella enterica subsp. enterica serovar Stanleyville]EDT2851306.1 hypothetical protein [Salmonella enterica subsp. enterica serovar Stanleyville]EDV0470503.1 hypothetical protein [Salmonella enterica subsp. enterica serovar Stanleyville]